MTARALCLALAAACIAVAVLFVRPVATPGPAMRDFEAYWSAGAAWNDARDPYGRAIWNAERGVPGVDARRDELLPFVGPPATLALWSVLARLPYTVAAAIWWTALALCLLGAVALTLRAAAPAVSAFSLFSGMAFAIAFGPATSDLALGQVALLALFGALAAVAWANRSVAAAALASFGASFQPNVALGLVSQLGRNRATLAIAAGAAAAYLAGAAFAGWAWPLHYAALLSAHGDAERWSAIQFAPAAIVFGFGAAESVARAAGWAAALAALLAGAALAARVRDAFARFAALSALVPFVAGFFHEHDAIVALPAAIWCAVRARGPLRALAAAGTLLVAVDWLGLAQRPSGIAQSALLGAAALLAFAALGERRLPRAELAASIPLAALFAAAAWIGATHPAPVWPDALGAFSAPVLASAAQVWQAEQRQTGLLAQVPAWALLRTLPLCGCALLCGVLWLSAPRSARPALREPSPARLDPASSRSS